MALASLTIAGLASADPTPIGVRLVTHAREVLGTGYNFGGRLGDGAAKREGIDCQGVIFYAAERVGRCGWKSFSVLPTKTVRTGELGKPVPGMDPVATGDLDIDALKPGDLLFLVGPTENPAEPSIGKLGETPVWVWHTGLYAGDGSWIVGDHYAGEAVETPLAPYLEEHADTYTGVFVLRLETRPSPNRCRHHPKMGTRAVPPASRLRPPASPTDTSR